MNLASVMRREQIDMWVVICREHNEDPIYTTLVPAPSLFAWRLTMLVFFDRGAAGIERLIVNPSGSGDLHKACADFYTPAFEPATLTPWQRRLMYLPMGGPVPHPRDVGLATAVVRLLEAAGGDARG